METASLLLMLLALVVLLCRLLGTHRTLRWPIFLVISSHMAIDLVLYIAVRLCILAIEWCSFKRRRRERLLEQAGNYDSWRRTAESLDVSEGRDGWRAEPQSRLYDWRHAVATTQRLRVAREASNVGGLISALEHCLKPNFCGVLEQELYTHARAGTKTQIEDFAAEVCASLKWLAATGTDADAHAQEQRKAFFNAAQVSFGTTGLFLSGGAIAGVYHYGVVRALLQQGVLPRVICGASAGALVGAFACCRDDAELRQTLEDEADLFREMGSEGPLHGSLLWKLKQLFRRGRIYDSAHFRKHLQWFSRGLTFREAFELSGRVLTITCTPTRSRGKRAPPLLLNHVETPNVDIASAICASVCIPGLIEPVYLLEKKPDGTLEPFHQTDELGMRIVLRDGSYECDVPLKPLAAQFGVAFSIVSQVNPHVVPFYVHPCGRPGRPSGGRARTGAWRGGFFFGALEVALKEDLKKQLRTLQRLNLLVDLFGVDWSNLWLQDQDGSVTITPELESADFLHALDNLKSPSDLSRRLRRMERATWEALPLIRIRMDVQKALDACAAIMNGDGADFEDGELAAAVAPTTAPALRRARSGTAFGE